MIGGGKNTMELIIAARDRTSGAFTKINSRVGGLAGVAKKTTAALKKTAKAGVLIGATAVLAGITGSTIAFMKFEDAMANVRKTTGMTKEQISLMGDAINDMALKIPVAQTELAAIAATAGQLGIIGQKNILGFTDTVAKMTTAFDMDAEAVAIAMAKLTNIYDIPIEQVGNLGSAINFLGNTTAASESQIMAFSMALGPAGQQLGFAATDVISLGASMIGMGMDASNAGTRLNRAFSMIGQNLDEVASFMGVTTDEFTQSFEDMPMDTFLSIIDKLSQVEGKLKANTVAANLFGEIGAKGIKSIAEDVDGVRKNLIGTEREFKANTSLSEEFAAKTDTLKAKFQLLKNSISSLLIDIGGELAPSLNTIIDGLRNILPAVKDLIFEIGSGFSEMFESIGRQAGATFDPLIAKVKEAGEKIHAGLDFKTILDDIGVFIGAGLNPLIRGLTWLIEKLGPLWELIGKGATIFHNLANALKTEEGRIDDVVDATEKLTEAKQTLFDIDEKLRGNIETLSETLESAGGWTDKLANLQATAKVKTDALATAQKIAAAAIAEHGAESEIAKVAIKNVELAEDQAEGATDRFTAALDIATTSIIDEGVATGDLEQAHLDFITTSEDVVGAQEDVVVAVADVTTELEEAKQAPYGLGTAFTDLGKLVARIFLAIPLKIAEAILSVQDTISGGLSKIGLGGFGEKLEADTEFMKEKIADIKESLITNIEDPLSEDIPESAEEMKEAIVDGLDAIDTPAKKAKEGIEEIDGALEEAGDTATETGGAGEDAFEKVEVSVDKATGKVEILTDNLGETVDAFEDNADAAQALLDLDWEVFSKLEMDLPRINTGIDDMSSTFKGLKNVLEDNIENLESVKESVASIGELISPFAEKGFMNGIKSIGIFANILKDAGSAINTFADLQEVSIDGMINFSLHVHDMVSALEILESQMEELVPSFGEMDLLITNVADSFLYGGGKMKGFISDFDSVISSSKGMLTEGAANFNEFNEIVKKALDAGELTYLADTYITETDLFMKQWKTITVEDADDVRQAMYGWMGGFTEEFETTVGTITSGTDKINSAYNDATMNLHNWIKANYGLSVSQEELYDVMQKPPEEQQKWFDEMAHSNTALTFQMDKQTNALAAQTAQLSKITDALAPYLNFMRTLNEIAALSALSTTELNSGLESIEDTLVNLGSALSTFNLGTVMESLFGTKIPAGEDLAGQFTGGLTTGFTDTMLKYQTPLNTLIKYVERLAGAISGLVTSFKALGDIGDSVLADQVKLKEVFKSMLDIMTNFSTKMGGTGGMEGFAQKFADGMDAMVKSADPLITYFQDNNAAVGLFNTTLLTFKSTLSNVIDTMDMLKNMSETVVPSIDELGTGFDRAKEFIDNFDNALMGSIGLTCGEEFDTYNLEKMFDNVFTSLMKFRDDWKLIEAQMGDSFEVFATGSSTITGMINNVLSLSSAFVTLGNSTMASAKDMERSMRNLDVFIARFTEVMASGFGLVVGDLKALDTEWLKYSKDMETLMPSFKDATSDIGTLLSTVTSLNSAFKTLSETSVTSSTDFDKGFSSLIKSVSNFTVSLKNNVGPLIDSLKALQRVWLENEEVLFPLMRDFGIIVYNLKGMADAANTMTDSFSRLNRGWIMLEIGFERLVKFIKTTVDAVKEFYTPESAAEVSRFIKDIELVIGSFQELNTKIESALNDIKSKIATSVGIIETNIKSLENLNDTMFTSGQNLISSLINGMNSMQTLLETAVIAVANTIKAYLGVSSNTELGALSNVMDWPKNLMQSFSKGIEAEMNGLNISLGNIVAPAAVMGGGNGGGNHTSVVINISQKISDKTTADYAVKELERTLKAHVI